MEIFLAYLIPVLLLLVVLAIFMTGILTVGAFSKWIEQKQQPVFSIMLWLLGLGIAIPPLTQNRVLNEENVADLSLYSSGIGKFAMTGLWVNKLLTWSVALLAISLLFSRFVQSKQALHLPKRSNSPTFLILAVIGYIVCDSVVSSAFGTKPEFNHDLIYPFLLFGAALTLHAGSFEATARTARHVFLAILVISLLAIPIVHDRVLQTDHHGLIPGFSLRLWGATQHANALGAISMFYLIIERLAPWRNKTLRVLGWVIAIGTLILTQSKTNWAVASILAAVYFIKMVWSAMGAKYTDLRQRENATVILGTLIIGSALLFSLIIAFDPQTIVDKIDRSFISAGSSNLSGRDVLWEISIEAWKANPLFGYGPTIWSDEFRKAIGISFAYHGHNQYFNTLSRSGLVGFSGLIFILSAYFYYAVRYLTITRGVLLAAFLFIMLRNATETPFNLWSMMSQETLINMVMVALIAQIARSRSEPNPLSIKENGPR